MENKDIITVGDQWLNPEEIDRLETAYKAGMKVVVDTFHDDICSMAKRFPTAKELMDFVNKWQAKLKEWGIDER